MTESIQEQVGILSAIESECHLIQIGREMLCADLVPCSHDAALQEREGRFDCVGMNVALNIDAVLVPDGLVFFGGDSGFGHGERIGSEFIRNDHINILAHVLTDVLCHGARLRIPSMEETQIAIALADSNNHFLRFLSSVDALSDLLPANVGFVHFDSAIKHRLLGFVHGSADAMAEVPRRLVADSKSPLDLIRGHSLACFTEKQGGEKPLLQREMGVIEDRASGHSELVIAVLAVEELLRRFQFDGWHLTARALNAAGPAQPDKQLAAFFIGIEQVYNVN